MKTFRVLGSVALISTLVACGQQTAEEQTAQKPEAKPLSKEELLTQRAEDRWQALKDWDMEKAYGYLSPGTREGMSLPVFIKKKATSFAQMQGAVVESTQCEEQVCTLKLRLSYIYNGSVAAMRGQEDSTVVEEKWIAADNNWFYVPN